MKSSQSPSTCQRGRPPLRTAISFFTLVFLSYVAFYFISPEQVEKGTVPTSGQSVQFSAQMQECNCRNNTSSVDKGKPRGILKDQPQSHCSVEATLLGPGQNVISYSLFTRRFWNFKNNRRQEWKQRLYKSGFRCNIKSMRKLYPGWVMRIYTNLERSELCDVACEPDVYICDVRNLPKHLGNLLSVNPTIWRFHVLGDPTVNRFIVRDSDARLLPRERAAVDEWIASEKPFHAMRDYPAHTDPIMAGCWGGNNALIGLDVGHKILANMLQLAKEKSNLDRGGDQIILKNVLYDKLRSKFLIHDSYHCKKFNDSVPFPTQRSISKDPSGRLMNLVVGMSGYCSLEKREQKLEREGKRARRSQSSQGSILSPCPYECRPIYGKNWTYC